MYVVADVVAGESRYIKVIGLIRRSVELVNRLFCHVAIVVAPRTKRKLIALFRLPALLSPLPDQTHKILLVVACGVILMLNDVKSV